MTTTHKIIAIFFLCLATVACVSMVGSRGLLAAVFLAVPVIALAVNKAEK